MVRIEASFRPVVLDRVRESLATLGIAQITEVQTISFGAERAHQELYRGLAYDVDSVPRVKVEFVVQESLVPQAIDAISAAAKTKSGADGSILVLPVLQALTIGQDSILGRPS